MANSSKETKLIMEVPDGFNMFYPSACYLLLLQTDKLWIEKSCICILGGMTEGIL